MGIEFRVGHAKAIYEDNEYAQSVNGLIREAADGEVPLGEDLESPLYFSSASINGIDLGWSWWNELKALIRRKNWIARCAVIMDTYAWAAVFVDARIEPIVVWPNGEEPPEGEHIYSDDAHVNEAMKQMVEANAAPREIRHGLQVFDLRGLFDELKYVASELGYKTDAESMGEVARRYLTDDASDEDPEVQCLVHALVSCHKAVEAGAPLWLAK